MVCEKKKVPGKIAVRCVVKQEKLLW